MRLVYLLIILQLIPFSVASKEINKGDNLYLQACGGNPSNYKSEPKVIPGLLYEVPNFVVSLISSPYGRPFTVNAQSKIKVSEKSFNAQLSNFRDFKVTENGKILYENKVSGASSIYELKHNGDVFAWALGWHKQCYETYEKTEFSVLRVIFPVRVNGVIKIEDKLLQGAYIKEFSGALSKSNMPVIMQSADIYSSGATSCYYCLPRVFTYSIDNGLKEVKTVEELNSVNVNLSDENPLIYVSWMSQYGLKNDVFNYVGANFKKIYEFKRNPHDNWIQILTWKKLDFEQQYEQCLEEINSYQNGNDSSLSAMGWACFPALQHLKYFEDLSKYRE